MTDTLSHYATCEQLDAALSALQRLCSHVAELRDAVEHLERMHETKKAALLDIYERLDKLKLDHESNWARIVKLEDAQEPAQPAAPAGSLVEGDTRSWLRGDATPSPLTRCALDAVGTNPQDIATAVRLLQALATYKPARWDDAGDLDACRLNQDARAELAMVAAELGATND